MGNTLRKGPSETMSSSPMSMYGHRLSDLSVFIANIFMFGFAVETTIRGYESNEKCELPIFSWMLAQTIMIFILQLCAPLLLIVPRSQRILAPVLAAALFVFQWILLFIGWQVVLSPSNCHVAAPYSYEGAYWLVVVYSLAIPLESIWYIKTYRTLFSESH